jgi:hypothetical protein
MVKPENKGNFNMFLRLKSPLGDLVLRVFLNEKYVPN